MSDAQLRGVMAIPEVAAVASVGDGTPRTAVVVALQQVRASVNRARMGAAAAEANARREHERAALLATQAQAVLERTALLHKAARRRLTAATWLMVLSLAVAVGVLISLYTGGLHR